ncbi:MAG: T9SS type A sorting domain-containing protein [Rubricoccaceae bacterium]|nr:T9SS type A sorting domain-containing protein [Rubricoccaceae bacterium]
MRTPRTFLLVLLVLGLTGFSPDKDRDRDRDRGAQRTATESPRFGNDGPTPGSCELGTAAKDLDVNRVQARAFNTGSLFFGATAEAIYLVPKSSGTSAIFASGIWIGGMRDGQLTGAGSRYDNFEFWPGPLDPSTGRPVNPSNCATFDRIFKVSGSDIDDVEAGAPISDYPDLQDWPADLGAPVLAAPGNNVDDDNDGLIDEGEDEIDNDGDGLIDERDEKERRVDGGYDFAAGDRPDIIGDQSLWWIMNDVGNQHDEWNTPPVGVEVRVQMFAFDRDNPLGDVTFYKYTVVYYGNGPGTAPLMDTYLSVFSDPDLGNAADDLVGSDTTLSLGYVYNATNIDSGPTGYGVAPPAVGYDFFQGPIVDGDTLGLTRFSYFINGGPPGTSDPLTGTEYYNVMQGIWTNGLPMVECGIGINCAGDVTVFAFPGDPVARDFWSEVSVGNSGGDRRLVVTTGPFELNYGEQQDIVFGIVYGRGNSNLSSISALRANDIVAQSAYDADFEVPEPPPAPEPCDALSPRLQPGSGDCLESVELDGEVTLVWGYPESSENFLGLFEDLGYEFEGFNVYQYPTSQYNQNERVRVATFDKINGIFQVNNLVFDLDVGDIVQRPAAFGSDSGLQYFYQPEGDNINGGELINYQDYFFAVSAYAVNEEAPLERVIESSPTFITVRPSGIDASGNATQTEVGQVLTAERIGGEGIGEASAIVVDPTRISGDSYTVTIQTVEVGDTSVNTFIIRRGGEVIFDGVQTIEEDGLIVPAIPITSLSEAQALEEASGLQVFTGQLVLDGLQFVNAFFPGVVEDADGVPDFSGDGNAIVEVAYPGVDDVCAGAAADPGCANFPGNTVWHDLNSTGSYYVSAGGGTGGLDRLSRYIEAAVPEDFEIRFTEECATEGSCYGAYGFLGEVLIVSVPFELWNLGTEDDDSDDVRMIPFLNNNGDPLLNWEDQFTGVDPWPGSTTYCAEGCPITDWIYWMQPDRPNGYELFNQAARDFGGAGAVYDPTADGDDLIDQDPFNGGDCPSQGFYVNRCYDNQDFINNPGGSSFIYPIGRMVYADANGDGMTPPVGTVDRLITTPKGEVLLDGDQFRFDTSDLVLVPSDQAAVEEALDLIGVVPNPYLGRSLYETGPLDRRVRFINLPPQVTIRIYTVSGTLIRELFKDGASRSLDWDLTTFNNLPVASGMYLVHVDARDETGTAIGERILKLGVVNRQIDVDVF